MSFYLKKTLSLPVIILAIFLCSHLAFAEEARFFSSKGGSVIKSRKEETKINSGRGLLSTAKSASGVASALYPIPVTKTDRESSRRLLEMFDRKKNWMFREMEDADQEQEDLSIDGDYVNEDQRMFLDSYRKSNGVVQDFIRGEGKKSRSKKSRKPDKRQQGSNYLEDEDQEEDRLDKNDIRLDLVFEKKDEKSESAFSGNSPFSSRNSITDFSPFARRKNSSGNPFRTNRDRVESKAGRFGARGDSANSAGQLGRDNKGGFFNLSGERSQSIFGNNSFLSGKSENAGQKMFGIAPLNFGSNFSRVKSTPITGVGVDELNRATKAPAVGTKALYSGNPISDIISRPPSISAKRSTPLLFQGNIQGGPAPSVRGGLLNNRMRSPFDKKPGGR